jgi:hypothetical protein
MEPNTNEAQIKVSLRDGVFEFSGSEAFVSQQIENFKELIKGGLTKWPKTAETSELKTNGGTKTSDLNPEFQAQDLNAKNFPKVFHVSGDQVSLIKAMPGTDKAKKTVNVALTYLWGSRSLGVPKVSIKNIRAICEKQGCLDESNFSSHIQSAQEWIVVEGKKHTHQKMCELTLPGVEAAEKLLDEMNGK